MDYLNLVYPLFTTTEVEKQVLRKCELWLAANLNYRGGLCNLLSKLQDTTVGGEEVACVLLKRKIRTELQDNYLEYLWDYSYHLKGIYTDKYYARTLIRRIWINKLLSYTGE